MTTSVSTPPFPTWQQRLEERDHRGGPTVMYQRWEHLLFLHWRWNADAIQRTLPPGLTVDVADGAAWLGLTPLFLRHVRPRFLPAVSSLSDFLELNLRTYVIDAHGRPGIYFYSLDCNQRLVVEGARRLLQLRYEHAILRAAVSDDGTVAFSARRDTPGTEPDLFEYHIMPIGGGSPLPPSLEFFLIERYRLFGAAVEGPLTTIHVSHVPYRLHPAELSAWGVNALLQAGFDVGNRAPDHVCGAEPLDVEISLPGFVGRG